MKQQENQIHINGLPCIATLIPCLL